MEEKKGEIEVLKDGESSSGDKGQKLVEQSGMYLW